MNGTSMATPIASGASAMVLSLLGASDGNYFKAEQVQSEQGGGGRGGGGQTGRWLWALSQAGC